MKTSHFITIAIFIGLFLILYFGFDTKSNEHKAMEKSRANKLELINIDRVINESKATLNGISKVEVMQIENELTTVEEDSVKVKLYTKLASLWYKENNPLISGHYAEQIATILQDIDSWSIAGTTYAIAGKRTEEGNQKQHAIQKSRDALEKALSFQPKNIDNQVNLALSYVDAPPQDNPMKGVLMLIDLNKNNPDNPTILFNLGRLALKTNQLEKAVERLTKVVDLRADFRQAHCLLYEVYSKLGDEAKSIVEKKLCELN